MNLNLKSLSLPRKAITYGRELQPARDWHIVLGIALIVLIGSVLWNMWIFSQATDDQPIGEGVTIPEPAPLTLDATRELFTERAEERARYVNSYRFTDPSR